MDLSEAAEVLYSLPPDEFVGHRTMLAAEVRADGDRQLAAAIKKLPKPATAAWAVNMLLRHEGDQVDQVLSLGGELREAQAAMQGDQLRELGRQRRQLTAAVTRQARSLAAGLGQQLGDPVAAQVEDTLHAAMVDEEAAAAVRTGLLVRPLAVTGLGAGDVAASVAVASALEGAAVRRAPERARAQREVASADGPALTVVPDNTRVVEQTRRDLTEAEEALAAAERKLAKAVRRVEKREARGLQLQGELEELRRRVAEMEQRMELNEEELAGAEDQRDSREGAVERARAAVRAARKALDDLG